MISTRATATATQQHLNIVYLPLPFYPFHRFFFATFALTLPLRTYYEYVFTSTTQQSVLPALQQSTRIFLSFFSRFVSALVTLALFLFLSFDYLRTQSLPNVRATYRYSSKRLSLIPYATLGKVHYTSRTWIGSRNHRVEKSKNLVR